MNTLSFEHRCKPLTISCAKSFTTISFVSKIQKRLNPFLTICSRQVYSNTTIKILNKFFFYKRLILTPMVGNGSIVRS